MGADQSRRAGDQHLTLRGELLKEMMEASPQYEQARRQYLALPPKPVGNPGEPLPQRETLYNRAVLR